MGCPRVSACILPAALLALSCAFVGAQPSPSEGLTVAKLNANKDAYVGKKLTLKGEVYVLTISGLHACNATLPCPKYDDALLTLVNLERDAVVQPDQIIRLYRRSPSTNRPEPIHCTILDENTPTFDCGPFVRGTVTTVQGVFTKEQVPDQVVGDSTGRTTVVSYRDAYFLLID